MIELHDLSSDESFDDMKSSDTSYSSPKTGAASNKSSSNSTMTQVEPTFKLPPRVRRQGNVRKTNLTSRNQPCHNNLGHTPYSPVKIFNMNARAQIEYVFVLDQHAASSSPSSTTTSSVKT
ncbi:unnamed protein product [Adineta ricciae]|uniref:Uncharacterized protein n=1 Tax=Adineta ricciae TaxID=249248 RepID=A0A815TV49_ADIRI|nr:unnamed protein product [Adineta ricciae]